MAARYAPLNLHTQLNPLPQNFIQILPQYDGTCEITARHVDKVNDFIDLEEVDEEDVKMRLLAQSFFRDVKRWFKGVRSRNFATFQELEDAFIARWSEKNNPLQILAEYGSLKRQPEEMIQEFTTRFNKVYNSIPTYINPPPGLTLLHYPNGFNVLEDEIHFFDDG